MADEQTILINGKEHKVGDLSETQVNLVAQVSDLEQRIRQLGFNLEQTQGARNYFMSMLTASFEESAPAEAANDG